MIGVPSIKTYKSTELQKTPEWNPFRGFSLEGLISENDSRKK
jgi:hypothetical protein